MNSDTEVLFRQKVDFIQENIQIITSHKTTGIHKRHKSRVGEIEYGICSRLSCRKWDIVEKHHRRLKGHDHPKELRGEKRIQTCPDCHEKFHKLADKLEEMILKEYPLKHPDRFSISELMRVHLWEFDELNRRYYELGEDPNLEDIVAEGKRILSYVKVRR